MSNPNAKTIQIFLPTGEARGIRIAEFTIRTVQAVLIPRSELAAAKARPELDQIAVYFLFGDSEESAKPIVYIGQTEDIRKRLDHHNSNKDFWRTAILGISRTQNFTQAHIRYLEWHCVKKAKEVGRYALDNDQTPSKPFVTEPIEADILDAFETLSTLISTLGFPVFEPLIRDEQSEQFYLRGPDASATGELVEDGFVVRAGATARLEVTATAGESIQSTRNRLIESGVLVEDNGRYAFTQDYLFQSPSGASSVVYGRRSNGWVEWKNADGATLHDVKRADAMSE